VRAHSCPSTFPFVSVSSSLLWYMSTHSVRHADKTECPKCGALRYVVDPRTGASRPSRTMYHFPLGPCIRSLFSRPEVAAQMRAEPGARPEGDMRYTGVWKEKILDNPHMSGDCRNIGATLFSDGVPWSLDRVQCANVCGVCVLVSRLSVCHFSMLGVS
jgi:hypothetical protein